jgi:hypothetical protein
MSSEDSTIVAEFAETSDVTSALGTREVMTTKTCLRNSVRTVEHAMRFHICSLLSVSAVKNSPLSCNGFILVYLNDRFWASC